MKRFCRAVPTGPNRFRGSQRLSRVGRLGLFRFLFLSFWLAGLDLPLRATAIVDACILGTHNCDTKAACTPVGISFTCSCNSGFEGDGVLCGVRIPPTDIGRGDHAAMTWTKDDENLYNGIVTTYTDYSGTVCPGQYRVYAKNEWLNYEFSQTPVVSEHLSSTLFDGTNDGGPWQSKFASAQSTGPDTEDHVILGTPCYIALAGYAWQARGGFLEQNPSSMVVAGANSTGGPWTDLHSFSAETNWTVDEIKTWPTDVQVGPFRFFRFTIRRASSSTTPQSVSGEQAFLYAEQWTELDECAAGVHNCAPDRASCTNTDGSFTCACTGSWYGDGVACGWEIPPADIGRGDNSDFTWTKDTRHLYNRDVTIYKDYAGSVCAGQYRVYTDSGWQLNPGLVTTTDADENLPSSLFDGSWEGSGWRAAEKAMSRLNTTDSNVTVMVSLPCYITLAGYAWMANSGCCQETTPSAMTVSASNSTEGPWTFLHDFRGITTWGMGDLKTWAVDTRVGPFRIVRFTIHTVQATEPLHPSGDQAILIAAQWTGLDECAAGTHNCDVHADCTDTQGSFTCTCTAGWEGDGVVCGIRIPPSDIGRGDSNTFTWNKDTSNLYNGVVTIHKDYHGAVCPGEFRIYAPNSWLLNPGVDFSINTPDEGLPSVLFDGEMGTHFPWHALLAGFPGIFDTDEWAETIILGTPCHITLSGYAFQARQGCCAARQAPSAMNISASNSTEGPWTPLHSFSEEGGWSDGEVRTWPVDAQSPPDGPFRFFRFTFRRVAKETADDSVTGNEAILYASNWIELDECAAGVHNCHPQANCTNTNGSFTCACYPGLEGDGTNICGILLPPLDIGRGDNDDFTWTKDGINLYGGQVTIYKNYTGAVCPGEYRVYSSRSWMNNPGDTSLVGEGLPSSLFDRDTGGFPWRSKNPIPGYSNPSGATDTHLILGLPCFVSLNGYAWNARGDCCADRENPSEMSVEGGNSTSGPWTALHNFTGLTDWQAGDFKTFFVGTSAGPFSFLRFNVHRVNQATSNVASGAQAILSAFSWTELDECATGLHDCASDATCTNTNGSFTCACPPGLDGDGTVCGIRIPPPDIGRGDADVFTWTKDLGNLFSGYPTIYTHYGGSVCPGVYRAYTNTEWSEDPGLVTTVAAGENLPSSLFDGTWLGWPWKTQDDFAGTNAASEAAVDVILETPCYFGLKGYAWQAHEDCCPERNPSSMSILGGNSSSGPWTVLHSYEGVTSWVLGETKHFASNVTEGRFRYFVFRLRRASNGGVESYGGDQAFFYATDWSELDECAAGVHNCDSQATCTNTNGSFACACNGGLDGDGVACGIRIPPPGIGRGDVDEFTWTKDIVNLFSGFPSIYRNYGGSVCPGEYRIFTSHEWSESPGVTTTVTNNENPPSSLFDGSGVGLPWKTQDTFPGLDSATESAVHVILQTPCYFSLKGYAWQAHEVCCETRNPSALNVSGANSTDGPWTDLGSYSGVSYWTVGETKTFPSVPSSETFRFFRLTLRRASSSADTSYSGDQAYFLGAQWTELDECAAGVHNCDSEATCTNTNGSFTCACPAGVPDGLGDGTVCGWRVPPTDIGRGDPGNFTWTKDASNLFNGFVTIYKEYTGSVCPGTYRAISAQDWWDSPGATSTSVVSIEWPPSSLFDGSSEGNGYASAVMSVVGQSSIPLESAVHVILRTPCFITLAGYSWVAREDTDVDLTPSAMNVSGSNSTNGPWTTLHSFSGVTDWQLGETKTWSKDEPMEQKTEIFVSSGKLIVNVSEEVTAWTHGRPDAPILWTPAPAGPYTARTNIRMLNSPHEMVAGLVVYDNDGDNVEFHFGAHKWLSQNGVCFQTIGGGTICNGANPATSTAVTAEMHSHANGVFDFYTWIDPSNPSTRTAVKLDHNNGVPRTRVGLFLKASQAGAAEFDWFELEYEGVAANCHANASCANTLGTFLCSCVEGYTGDGVNCTELDECATGVHNCDPQASCTNTNGSFTCACPPGIPAAMSDGTLCGVRVPPADIGRGDNNDFTWTKDTNILANGSVVTIYKEYSGSVCSGQYRVYAPQSWYGDPGLTTTLNGMVEEHLPSSAFDGSLAEKPWASLGNDVAGTTTPTESDVQLILKTPCYITMAGYAVQARNTTAWSSQTPSAMSVSGANSTDGPWTMIHSFDNVTDWTQAEQKIWPANVRVGPFNFFRFTIRRILPATENFATISQAHIYAAGLTDLDECATGVHNCDPQAACTNTNGSFACVCNGGSYGDGVACGVRIPPVGIGRGDGDNFTWTQDPSRLFGGLMTTYKDYSGEVCPGQYRVYTNTQWHGTFYPSSVFDGSVEGKPWHTLGNTVEGRNSVNESNVQLILETPCLITLAGYTWQNRVDGWVGQSVSAMNVSGSNSTDGPWTQLHSFDAAEWVVNETKTFSVDARTGPFRYFRFTIRKVYNVNPDEAGCPRAFLLAAGMTELDECAAGVHNCDPQASCTNTNGSFTCACPPGLPDEVGDGTLCGFRVPPADIGRGDNDNFTWTKDPKNRFGGFMTIYKDHNGAVCPGRYRVYTDWDWYGNLDQTTVHANEYLPSSLFDGSTEGWPWHTASNTVAGLSSGSVSDVSIILGTPCFLTMSAYKWQSRIDAWEGQNPSMMNVSAANSTDGPWTHLQSFSNVADWVVGETKTFFADDSRIGPFRFFRFTIGRVQNPVPDFTGGTQAFFLAGGLTELDECAAGVHNCDPQATCTNTNGSFVCSCNAGLDGDGVVCGVRVPPADIGRGDNNDFTWTKDTNVLANGSVVTIYKNYNGAVCPGEYRVFAPGSWHNYPGLTTALNMDEHLPSSAFDGSNEEKPFGTLNNDVAGLTTPTESDVQLILKTPCHVTMAGYAAQMRDLSVFVDQSPSAMTISAANSTDGPWTTLHSFDNVTDWTQAEQKIWPADVRVGPFNFFRFTIRRVTFPTLNYATISGAHIYAASLTELDECATGVHNCDPQASCTNTNGSFTCACPPGIPAAMSDGTLCGVRVPPADIGRGDNNDFTWTKDTNILANGSVTIYKNYNGSVCPGEYRVYAPNSWYGNPGFTTSLNTGLEEHLPSSAFDGSLEEKPFASVTPHVAGTTTSTESDVQLILKTPCYITMAGYAVQARNTTSSANQTPSAMNVSGANSTDGPWTTLHSFSDVTDWTQAEQKIWPADVRVGPFNFFRFTVRRVIFATLNYVTISQAHIYAAALAEFDECTAGVHNCDPQATCTNTNGSFTCACNGGLDGDGVMCGIRIPPLDIGRGDNNNFTWTKDTVNLFGGHVTIYKEYTGTVCQGEYRVFAPNGWLNNPGVTLSVDPNECLPSSMFDGSAEELPFHSPAADIAGLSALSESDYQVLLQTPCFITMAGYGLQARNSSGTAPSQTPSALNVSASNSSTGPWTLLHSFEGEDSWNHLDIKQWPADVRVGPFQFFRFTVRRVASGASADWFSAGQAFLYAGTASATDFCASGGHFCDANAVCSTSNTSFTCTCNSGFAGDGVSFCGLRVPPEDIGGGYANSFTWTKDKYTLFNGVVTIFKDYYGDVCPGQYRVYTPNGWLSNPGLNTTVVSDEWLPSSAFDGKSAGKPWASSSIHISGLLSSNESAEHIILGTPCYITLKGYSLQAREDNREWQSPSSMTLSGSNSTDGPWVDLHSFSNVSDWVLGELKTWEVGNLTAPFRFFRFTIRRISLNTEHYAAIDQAYLVAAAVTELDECAAGVHNCDPQANCTNTNGSFTCACIGALAGDGVACGIRIPPADIGRGDEVSFTWTKDTRTLFNGHVTIHKDYGGSVCPGQYRVFAPNSWYNNPGVDATVVVNEWLSSSLFDGSNQGRAFCTDSAIANLVAGQLDPNETAVEIILGTPCYLNLAGYTWENRGSQWPYTKVPSAMNVSGSNSTHGPWTTLHSFSGVTDWGEHEVKTWPVDFRAGTFRFFRFLFRRSQSNNAEFVCGEQAFLYASAWTELDECAAGVHNCHPQANCTNTNGSFTCACYPGLEGDGVSVCGIRIPPVDIGRADDSSFSWHKDDSNLFEGHATINKHYFGSVCPGEFRVYAPNSWLLNPGLSSSNVANEMLPSSLFDGSSDALGWCSSNANVSGLLAANESSESVILGMPCYVTLEGYAVQGRDDCCERQSPSAMNVSGSNSTTGPWTLLHNFTGVSDWTVGETKLWAVGENPPAPGPFRFFRWTVRRVVDPVEEYACMEQAFLLASTFMELDECAAGVHNCHPQANCTNTNGSFTCACHPGLEGDGTNVCGILLPPVDIGRGDRDVFTWTKDGTNLYNGQVTMYKDYAGEVCPGEYRVYSSRTWLNNSGDTSLHASEGLPSSLFDRDATGFPWRTASADPVAGYNDPSDSDAHVILGLPCFVSLNGYAWNDRGDCCVGQENPSAMSVEGSNSTSGPWTALHNFSGVTDWDMGSFKTWPVTISAGPFSFFRFNIKRVNWPSANIASGAQAILAAASWTGQGVSE
uniref:EGF-like domain-containing protein n=1 Tax=Chromera velia CCMP2878 TaxID=1169474 RepID=A0A0G4I101_9ALVE|eukprot:Cvel_1642.t1-p1 / transcript=Cvel_1642.t1 / gene=Cvel_1642 / organism=Chromera_velia_CCMP2878 / gene_product=Pro-epidermal growth factor, putative / transcript_product=Pro-epidermal growth factor, putative / location=Cvel_scaffold59:27127-48373(-) / protein_length=4439 / sequence_SO=supercontig / SO=protein_coding / is_pseudo=false